MTADDPWWERGFFVLSESGNKLPRPFSTTIHATNPNEVIQLD